MESDVKEIVDEEAVQTNQSQLKYSMPSSKISKNSILNTENSSFIKI